MEVFKRIHVDAKTYINSKQTSMLAIQDKNKYIHIIYR